MMLVMTGLHQQVFGNCALCGFNSVVVGGLEPVRMLGRDPGSTVPGLVLRYRCRDRHGCERRQRDFPNEMLKAR